MAALLTLMLLMYPPLAHWSIHQDKPEYAVYLLGLLCILPALPAIYRNRRISLGAGAAILLGLTLLLFPGWQGINLMQLTPVVINALLGALFANSLVLQRVPLITRLASIMRGGVMPKPVVAYTRKLTFVWTLFFFLLAATGLLLAILSPLETWSLFANLISYLLIVCLFLGEYFFRRWYLGELVDYSFTDFIKGIFRLDYRQIFRSRRLPDASHCILLCERRDLFIIGFIAVLMRRQTLLLPSNRTHGALQDVLVDYPSACCLVDHGSIPLGLPGLDCSLFDHEQGESTVIPTIPADHLTAIVFTSGTTGKPEPNPKYWGELVAGSLLLQQRLQVNQRSMIVATVPPQHMYGLETSVLAPLLSGASVYGGRPFYPADVQQALALTDSPSMLVTTPLHLRACVAAALHWPGVQQVISATAQLDQELAVKAEQVMQTRVREIFGCSEAGSFASRNPARENDWQMYDGMQIEQDGDTALISGGHLSQAFRFMGRQSDMIKIAGKRASLAELNIKLNSIEGVSDGVFLMREQQQASVPRLLALVVAPTLDMLQIQHALAASIDPVFLPRPLLKVDGLPRNEANKLPKQAMDSLLAELGY